MRVYQVMTTNPVAVDVEDGIDDALELMHEHGLEHLPVVDDGRLVGVLAETEVAQAVDAATKADGPFPSARVVMHGGAVACNPALTVESASELMDASGVPTLFVTAADGRLLGVLEAGDMIDWYGDADRMAAESEVMAGDLCRIFRHPSRPATHAR